MRGKHSLRCALAAILLASLTLTIAYFWRHAKPHYTETILQTERFGSVIVYKPDKIAQVVLFLTDKAQIASPNFHYSLNPLIQAAALIFVIDSDTYISSINRDNNGCFVVGGEIERLGQSLQSSLKLDSFAKPILVGVGRGALLAYVARFQSPDRFSTTLAYDLCPRALSQPEFCATSYLELKTDADSKYYLPHEFRSLPPVLRQHFLISFTASSQCSISQSVGDFKGNLPPSDKIYLQDALIEMQRDFLLVSQDSDDPVIEMPADGSKFAAIFFSGDGGWAGIDQNTGKYLNQHGIAIVGFNSLKYFWKRKTPEQAAHTVEKVLYRYKEQWKISRFALIGYSLGANAAPLIYNRLPLELQVLIEKIVLLAPESRVDLEVHITDWLGLDGHDAGIPLKDEIIKIPAQKVICIYGREDESGACGEINNEIYTIKAMPGGHHFNGDYSTLGLEILKFLGLDSSPPTV